MGRNMRRVTLLGAFEIEAEVDPPVRDGLILGSRREQMGFVLETSRENVEQILAMSSPPRDDQPARLVATVGRALRDAGFKLTRVELKPYGNAGGQSSYVQGTLCFKGDDRKPHRIAMTATEAIQLALTEDVPMWAATELLQFNVTPILDELDAYSTEVEQETRSFRSFVNSVTATDFKRFYESHGDGTDDAAG